MSAFRSDDRFAGLIPAALAACGFVISWYLIHHGWYSRDGLWDTLEYARYAHQTVDLGHLPYRDFAVEYPPLALPMFFIPSLIAGQNFLGFLGYQEIFGLMMVTFGVIAVGLAVFILARQRVSRGRLVAGVALGALAPLLIGAVILTRYDLWPVALMMIALAAIFFGWGRTGFVFLALGTVAKAFPIVILPIATIYVWRNFGRRRAIECVAIFGVVALACVVPFLAVAPHGVWESINGQSTRPLQIESLGAAVWLAAHQLIGTHVWIYFTHGSDNLNGHATLDFAPVMSALQLISLLVVWLFFFRGPATKQRLLTASAAAVCAFIVFDRVLSPQYLIWLVPLVITLPGKRGLAATALLVCAMGLTQIWYPLGFTELKELHPLQSWAVVTRDLVLVALLVTLAWPDVPVRRSIGSRGGGRLRQGRSLRPSEPERVGQAV